MEEKDLPKGWEAVRLGDYAQTEKGKKPKNLSKEKTPKYSIPYVNIKAFEKNVIDEFTDGKGCVLCEKDDFLMVWDGSRSGYVGKAIDGALGSTLVRIKLPKVNHDFAYYFLKSKFIEINTRAKGVGIPHVDPNIVWNYKFPLPPLPVQANIVSKIEELFSELDNGIEQLKAAKEQLKIYRQSVLKWAFEGKLTNKNVKDRELPKGWKMEMLGDIAEVKRGKSKHRPRNDKKLFGGKYPFIQTGEVKVARGGTIRKYTETYSEMGLEQSKLWPKGTLCLTIAANIADTAFLGFDACFPDSIVGIITNKEKLLIKYINFYVQNLKVKIDSEASATAQKNINVEFLDKMKIPLPGIEEQDKIVNEIELRLSVCDKVEEMIERAMKQSESLRQSILKKAFEGKLIEHVEEKEKEITRFYQIHLLALIIKNLKSQKEPFRYGEMALAKFVYLCDKIYGVRSGFNFKNWHYGPYDSKLREIINSKQKYFKRDEVIKVIDLDKDIYKVFKYTFSEEERLNSALNILYGIFEKYKREERTHKIELLATICKVIEDTQSLDLETIRSAMREWEIEKVKNYKTKAEKFTEEETKKCIEFIVKSGWDEKLIK